MLPPGPPGFTNSEPIRSPVALTRVSAEFAIDVAQNAVHCAVTAECLGRTGVEMEALTAVSVGLLTLYDMVKASDPAMVLGPVQLLRKSGGRSGVWARQSQSSDASSDASNAAASHG